MHLRLGTRHDGELNLETAACLMLHSFRSLPSEHIVNIPARMGQAFRTVPSETRKAVKSQLAVMALYSINRLEPAQSCSGRIRCSGEAAARLKQKRARATEIGWRLLSQLACRFTASDSRAAPSFSRRQASPAKRPLLECEISPLGCRKEIAPSLSRLFDKVPGVRRKKG